MLIGSEEVGVTTTVGVVHLCHDANGFVLSAS